MDNKAREARNAYMRAYRRRNPDKIKDINKRYWQKVSQQIENQGQERGA